MILTDEERRKFAEYCEVQVQSAKAIVSQMEKLGSLPEALVRIQRANMQAYAIVARDLRNMESQTIGGGG